jgi:Icc-related predicted phosphoesterase
VLDWTIDRQNNYLAVGDKSLLNKMKEIRPKYHIFGHIHGNETFDNNGILERYGTKFMNASQVKDNMFQFGLLHKGKVFEI